MTTLHRPVPHPLAHCPVDVPRWAHEPLTWVIGDDWPTGDEAATWQVADRWFAVASSLDAPHEAAFAAAAQIMSGDANAGFHAAWQRLAGDSSAPLNSLIEIAAELGALVEQCGRDLEAAKLEAWTELGLFLIDLIGLRALGASTAATGGLIAATRLRIQRIFDRLTVQLAAASPAGADAPGLSGGFFPPTAPPRTSPDERHSTVTPDQRHSAATPDQRRPTATPDQRRPTVTPDQRRPTVTPERANAPAGPPRPEEAPTVERRRGPLPVPTAQRGNIPPRENTPAPAAPRGHLPTPAPQRGDLPGPTGQRRDLPARATQGGGHPAPAPQRGDRPAPTAQPGDLPTPTPQRGDRPAAPVKRGAAEEPTRRLDRRGISAAGILARSRGAAVTTPAQQPVGADGVATRRIPPAELERIARSSREPTGNDPGDPGTRTVMLPAAVEKPDLPEKFGYAADVQQLEYSVFLSTVADETRVRIRELGKLADKETLTGSTQRGDEFRARSAELRALLARIEKAAGKVAAGYLRPAVVLSPAAADAEPPTGPGASSDVAPPKDERSTLNGSLPIDLTRRYDTYGGLRAPQAVHQKALEDAVPQDGNGRALRLADPRVGRWFAVANGGGPAADPARALNCVDGVLALFDTYMHGRPRVAAPRTFDSYAAGNPDRPIGGEWHGLRRIELATGTTFQNLCPYQGGADPEVARSAVDAAVRNLSNHLHNSGYGSFAFILTDFEGGGCHAWSAVNHDGTILFLDPQIGRIGEGVPLYGHRGVASTGNVVSMDALVVDSQGTPAPLPYHGAGQWSGASV